MVLPKGMMQAIHWLYSPSKTPVTLSGLIGWWEIRRIPFNFILGLLSLPLFAAYERIVEFHPPYVEAGEEDAVVIGFAILFFLGANILFVLAWIVDYISGPSVRSRLKFLSPILLWGLVFAMLLSFPLLCWLHYSAVLSFNLMQSS